MDSLQDIIPLFYRPEILRGYSAEQDFVIKFAFETGGFPSIDHDKDPCRFFSSKSDINFCMICHQPVPEKHHIVEHAVGGATVDINKIVLCGTCHRMAELGLWATSYLLDLSGEYNLGISRRKFKIEPEEYIDVLNSVLKEDVMNWPEQVETLLALYTSLGHVSWRGHIDVQTECAIRILRRMSSFLTSYGYDTDHKYKMPNKYEMSFKRYLGVNILHRVLRLIKSLDKETRTRLEPERFQAIYTTALHYRAGGAYPTAMKIFQKFIPGLLKMVKQPLLSLGLISYAKIAFINDGIRSGEIDHKTGIALSRNCLDKLEIMDDNCDSTEHVFRLKHVLIGHVHSYLITHNCDGALDALNEAREKIHGSDKYFSTVYQHLLGMILQNKGQQAEANSCFETALNLARLYRLNDREQKILHSIQESQRLH